MAPACDAQHVCFNIPGAFQLPFMPSVAGICVMGCDPVSQVRNDGAPACGSADPQAPTLGCYGLPYGYGFTCMPAGPAAQTVGAPVTDVTANACAPGFEPLFAAQSGSSTIVCNALCRPAPTSVEMPGQPAGVADSGFTCPDRGATGTYECRYWWPLEPVARHDQDGIGYCLDYTQFMFRFGYMKGLPYPSCTTLSDMAHKEDPVLSDAQYFGCMPPP
jgi:hypothetical protein